MYVYYSTFSRICQERKRIEYDLLTFLGKKFRRAYSPSLIRYEMEGSVEEYIDRHIRDPIEADKLRQVFAEA